MNNLKTSQRLFILFLILITVVGIDQWTKALAVEHLVGRAPIIYIGGVFQLVYAENPGAFLGMGGELPQWVRFVVFGLFVLVGLVVMLWSLIKNKMNITDLLAYSFILAGGIGNVIDRLTHSNGHVIDFLFIDLQITAYTRTGVFNIADVAIVAGFFIAIYGMIRERREMRQGSVG